MPTDKPYVSIVLPTYNGARYLRQAIDSCLNQGDTAIELIVVDDGSTDQTSQIIQSINDHRLRYVRQETNQGHIAALNKGFALAQGRWLTWTSDDNYYAPQAIEKMKETLHKTGVDFVYARYNVVDEAGNIQRQGRIENPDYLDIDNCVGGCFLYTRRVYEAIGDFSQDAFLAEDYEYWLRVRAKFQMKKMDEVLYFYRMHESSLTGTHKEEKVQIQVERIRDRFISRWRKDYFDGRKAYYQQRPKDAKVYLVNSLKANPFHWPSWRLLALVLFPAPMTARIRGIRRSLKD